MSHCHTANSLVERLPENEWYFPEATNTVVHLLGNGTYQPSISIRYYPSNSPIIHPPQAKHISKITGLQTLITTLLHLLEVGTQLHRVGHAFLSKSLGCCDLILQIVSQHLLDLDLSLSNIKKLHKYWLGRGWSP